MGVEAAVVLVAHPAALAADRVPAARVAVAALAVATAARRAKRSQGRLHGTMQTARHSYPSSARGGSNVQYSTVIRSLRTSLERTPTL